MVFSARQQRFRAILFSVLFVLVAGDAFAQRRPRRPPPPPPTVAPSNDPNIRAQQLYEQGLAEYDADRFPEALELFRQSFTLYRSPNAELYIARCYRELGRPDEAVREYQATTRLALELTTREDRYARTREASENELQQLLATVGRVQIDVAGLPPGTRVRLGANAETRLVTEITEPIVVPAGALSVRFEAERYEPVTDTVAVTAGAQPRIGATLIASDAPRSWGARSPGLRVGAGVGFGLAAAGLIVFTALQLSADSAYQTLVMRCGNGPCASNERETIDRGRALELGGNISLGGALVGAAVGTVMVVLATRPLPGSQVRVLGSAQGLALRAEF